jgi:hypothetical protein
MKLSLASVISLEKITGYLLQWRPESDKSQFLARAGYTQQNGEALADDIRRQLLPLEAQFEEQTQYGAMYSITGVLTGPTGEQLKVKTIWMIEAVTGLTKFITMYPAR